MQRATPVVINDKDDFRDFVSDMLYVTGIVYTATRPKLSLIFETQESRFLDFLRVVINEKEMKMNSVYHPMFAMDTLYLCGSWKFHAPVRLTFDFIIPVSKYHDALMMMAEEDFIGLGFIADRKVAEREGYDVIAVPTIPLDIIHATVLLDSLQNLLRADIETRVIVSEMLR